jgi:signal transduction histidine kinase
VAKRSRALLDSRIAEIALLDGDEFVIVAGAGERMRRAIGTRLPIDGSIAASALRTGRTRRYEDVPPGTYAREALEATRAIVTPMVFKGRTLGFLMLLDRLQGERSFTEDDERLLGAFATSAATAVATARSATDEALRRSIAAMEAERARWARELHDETLQELAGLRMLLSGARRSGSAERLEAAADESLELLTQGVANLRALISELRPAALDELGLEAALRSLAERVSAQAGVRIDLSVDLAWERGDEPNRLQPEVESVVYRLVQEALTNVVKHADAGKVHIAVSEHGSAVDLSIRDDGRGFASDAPTEGFGLMGMRERAALVEGDLSLRSAPGEGTLVTARLPVRGALAQARRDPAVSAG